MILHSGEGEFDYVTINLIGDGAATTVDIDLTKPPYGLAFQSMMPLHWLVRMKDGNAPKVTSLTSGKLHLEFDQPLPPPNEGTLSPRTVFDFYMFYGTPIAKAASKPKHGRHRRRY